MPRSDLAWKRSNITGKSCNAQLQQENFVERVCFFNLYRYSKRDLSRKSRSAFRRCVALFLEANIQNAPNLGIEVVSRTTYVTSLQGGFCDVCKFSLGRLRPAL